ADLDQFNAEMAMRHSPHAVPPIPEAADVVAAWHGAPILEYAIVRHSVVAFVLHDGNIAARHLPRTSEEIQNLAKRLSLSIEQRNLRVDRDARRLYDALIMPIHDLLPRRGPLTIVPDHFLWNVPFDVLISHSGKFLGAERALSYAPSLTMLESIPRRMQRSTPRQLLAFGDPAIGASTRAKATAFRDFPLGALPDAAHEARELSTVYGRNHSTVLTGASARESAFKKLAAHYRILHLATHGIVDRDSPLYSALVLAQSPNDGEDGLLEMREIRELDLHSDLVVLSACDTACGEVYPGEGVIGLSWAFLTAGCPTTVVSQWKADSHATAQLMIEFHRHLRAGDTKA